MRSEYGLDTKMPIAYLTFLVALSSCASQQMNVHRMRTVWNSSVLPLKPNLRLGHPENYLFSLSKKILFESKYPKNILFIVEKGSTGTHVFVTSDHLPIVMGLARGFLYKEFVT